MEAPERPWLRKLHWSCVAFSLLVNAGVAFVWWSDGRVSQEATECYSRALQALMDAESSLKRCGLDPPEPREREWKLLPSTAWEVDAPGRGLWKMALPFLALIPVLVVRGLRWRTLSRRRGA